MTREDVLKSLTTKTGRVFVSKAISEGRSPLTKKIIELTPHLDSSYSIKERVEILHLNYVPVCKICKTPVHNKQGAFPLYCSKECKGADHELKQEIKAKSKETMKARYGVEHPLQNRVIREKMFRTNLERYGETCSWKSSQVKEKCRETMKARYGVEHALQSDRFLEKAQTTCLKNYGCSNPMQSEENKEKAQATLQKKYGVENPSQYNLFKVQRAKTNLERYGSEYGSRKNYSKELLAEIENEFKNIKTGKDLVFRSCSASTKGKFLKQFRSDLIDAGINIPHQFVVSILEEHGICVEKNNRTVLKPKELDIWIPELNTGIEVNGIYWHSEKFKNVSYHQEKSISAKNRGISLIHVYDDLKIERTVLFVLNKLIQPHRVGARQCKVVQVPREEERVFLNENHVNGYIHSEHCLGLTLNGELIEVLSFGKSRFNTKFEFEVLRLCTKLGYQVTGGVSRLFRQWISMKNPQSIITYSSLDWGANRTWEKLGFVFSGFTTPGYSWVKQYQQLSRYQTQKKNLKNILKEQFDENLTEDQNMSRAGWVKLYNSGNEIFSWFSPKNTT